MTGLVDPALSARSVANELFDLLSAASPAKAIHFVERRFTDENRKRLPIEKRISSFMDWAARGGFELTETVEDTLDRFEALVRLRITDEPFRLAIEMDAGYCSHLRLGRIPFPVLENLGPVSSVANGIVEYAGRLAEAGVFSGGLLVARHGKVLARAAYGLANRDFGIANTVETRFNVASLTKSWTAVAACQMIEEGKLAFDDAVARYLDYPDAASAAQIQIRHLLSHTSGLGDYFIPEFEATPRQHLRSCTDYLNLCRHNEPEFHPGKQWRYSNVGMVLLGRIIEIVAGCDYFEHVADAVLKRAGMKRAGFPDLDQVNLDAAVGYHSSWSPKGCTVTNSLFEGQIKATPAGCGYATLDDVFEFTEAFHGGKLVGSDMVELMTTPKPELNSPDYGYGFSVHPKRALYGHSGGLVGASANVDRTCDPEGWVVVVLCNDLSMRAPVLKARQLVGVKVPEAEEARAWLPNSGLSAR